MGITVKKLKEVKKGWDLLVDQRSSAAIDGLEGDNSIIEKGEKALEELIAAATRNPNSGE